jgi:Bacterial SH3 domain
MAPKTPILIVAGLSGLAAVTGVTSAVIQSQSPQLQPTAEVTLPVAASPTPKVTIKPTTAPIVPQSAATTVVPDPTAPPAKSSESLPPVAPEAVRDVESCKITMVRVDDPDPPLNVRSVPGAEGSSTVVGQVKNGTYVTVVAEKDNWFQITTPVKGWIAKANTESTCNQKVERVTFAGGGTSANIADRFIGTGTHKYHFVLAKGQTLTVKSSQGPLPAIISPEGKFITGMNDDQSVWSSKLTTTGDYTLEMDSNFKGYKYAFTVDVK